MEKLKVVVEGGEWEIWWFEGYDKVEGIGGGGFELKFFVGSVKGRRVGG